MIGLKGLSYGRHIHLHEMFDESVIERHEKKVD